MVRLMTCPLRAHPGVPLLALYAGDLDRREVAGRLVVDGQVHRLPGERVAVDGGEDVRGGHRPAVRRGGAGLEEPLLAIPRNGTLAVAPVVLEGPRPQL